MSRTIGLYIDVPNLFYHVRRKFNGKIDYSKFLSSVKDLGNIVVATAYGYQINNEAIEFLNGLAKIGIEVNYHNFTLDTSSATKIIQFRDYVKHQHLINMAVDMVKNPHVYDYDTTVLCSTNNLRPVLDHLRDTAIKTIIYACDIPEILTKITDTTIEITQDLLEVREYGK